MGFTIGFYYASWCYFLLLDNKFQFHTSIMRKRYSHIATNSGKWCTLHEKQLACPIFTAIVFVHLNLRITCLTTELWLTYPDESIQETGLWTKLYASSWSMFLILLVWKSKKPKQKFARVKMGKENVSVLNPLGLWTTSSFPEEQLNKWKAIQKPADNFSICWYAKELRSIILGLPSLSGQIFLFQKWPVRVLRFAYIWQIPFIPSWQLWEQAHPVSSEMFSFWKQWWQYFMGNHS